AVDVDQLDRCILFELEDGLFGPHLVTAAVFCQTEIRWVLHRQVVRRELDLPDLETARSKLPTHAQRQSVVRGATYGRDRQDNAQELDERGMASCPAERASELSRAPCPFQATAPRHAARVHRDRHGQSSPLLCRG